MRNRIQAVTTTHEAAYNYSASICDAIQLLNESVYWLDRIQGENDPDSLRGYEDDRKWALSKVAQVRELVKQANYVKFGRYGVALF